MKMYTYNIEDYLSVMLGLCGELDAEAVAARAPVLKTSTTRGIKNLKDARVLIRHRYDDGRKYLRLSSVNGESHLRQLAPDLAENAKNVVNGELKYSGGKAPRMRERINSDFYYGMVCRGISLNGMRMEYKPKQINDNVGFHADGESVFSRGTNPDFEEIAARIPGKYTGVLTKRVVKERFEGSLTNTGSRTSRMSGVLFLEGSVYKVYALQDPQQSAWKPEAEFRASNYISGALERNCAYYRDGNIQIANKCILMFPSAESAGKMLIEQDNRTRIDPCPIYASSYSRPSYDLGSAFIRLLSTADWEKRLIGTLFPEGEYGETEDCTLPDGTEVYNFIGCDLNRIRFCMSRLKSSGVKSLILSEEWIEPFMKELFHEENTEIVTISEEDLEIIASNL